MRVALLVCSLFLFAGCDELFTCRLDPASTADTPVFELGGGDGSAGPAKLTGFVVMGQPLDAGQAEMETFWSIRVPDGVRYSLVERLNYGAPPPEFGETVAAKPLPSGYVYVGDASCRGVVEDCYFIITEDTPGTRVIQAISHEEYQSIVNPGGG